MPIRRSVPVSERSEVRDVATSWWPDQPWNRARYCDGAFHHVLVLPDVVARLTRDPFSGERTPLIGRVLDRLSRLIPSGLVPHPLDVRLGNPWVGLLTTTLPGSHRRDIPPLLALPALVELLDAFERVSLDQAGELPGPWDWCGGVQFPELVRQQLAPRLPGAVASAATRLVENLLALKEPDLVLVHGDFGPGNVLWEGNRVTGLIDWDHTCHGDRAIDTRR